MPVNNNHYFLYAKRHYKHGDLIKDLKKVHGFEYDMDVEYVEVQDIMSVLLDLVYQVLFSKNRIYTMDPEMAFKDFVGDLGPDKQWMFGGPPSEEYTFEKAVIRKCISVLSLTRCLDDKGNTILDIGEADPKVLELSDVTKNRLAKEKQTVA